MNDQADLFPSINLDLIKYHARTWADEYFPIIERVMLYKPSFECKGTIRYVLVFEIHKRSETSKSYPSYCSLSKKVNEIPPTGLLDETFLGDVHKNPPIDRLDWYLVETKPGQPFERFVSPGDGIVLYPDYEFLRRKGKISGYMQIIDLAHFLAEDDSYDNSLHKLKKIYLKDVIQRKEGGELLTFNPWIGRANDPASTQGRHQLWRNLLMRWAGLKGDVILGGLPAIEYLPYYKFNKITGEYEKAERLLHKERSILDYICLSEFAEYFNRIEEVHRLGLRLPSWVRPNNETEPGNLRDFQVVNDKEVEKPNQFPSKSSNRIFPCRAGTKWEDIHITAISNHSVKIRTPEGEERLTYGEMGFADRRIGDKPRVLWKILLKFCANKGEISPSSPDGARTIYKTVSDLNNKLKKFFGIDSSFLRGGRYTPRKGYVAAIQFSDQRDSEAMNQKRTHSLDDELREFMEEEKNRNYGKPFSPPPSHLS